MKKIRNILALVLCAILGMGAIACTPGGGDTTDRSKTTVIDIVMGDGGFGTDVLQSTIDRFEELRKDTSYADGKTGIEFTITTSGTNASVGAQTASDGYHLIANASSFVGIGGAVSNGWIANLDDIAKSTIPNESKTIVDKIPEENKFSYSVKNEAGERVYYGLPTDEAYCGLTFDKDLFDKEGFYIAKPDAQGTQTHNSQILKQQFKFTKTDKSVGPNGIAGDYDDGLPSSLYELIALCEYVKGKGVAPFILSGVWEWYQNYFVHALYSSLAGYDNAFALTAFNNKELEVVYGYTNEPLFKGWVDGPRMPKTVKVTDIGEATGYYNTMSLEKYYVFAFCQLMNKYQWFSANSEDKNHTASQANFIFGKQDPTRQGAMLIECSYWYNESRIRENFLNYEAYYAEDQRQLQWMSLPVNIFTSVDGSDKTSKDDANGLIIGGVGQDANTAVVENKKGEAPTLETMGSGFWCVNAIYQNDEEVMSALKDFFQFYYSDEELSLRAVMSGYKGAVNFEIKEEHLNGEDVPHFTKALFEMTKTAKFVYSGSDNPIYNAKSFDLQKGGNSRHFAKDNTAVRDIVDTDPLKLYKAFEDRMIDIVKWGDYMGTSQQVPLAKNFPEGYGALTGTPISYTKAS